MLVPSDSQKEFLERASKKYHDEITEEGVAYLTGPERGLTLETIERFRLGVVADPLPGHEGYRGYLSIPYLTNYGVVSIRYRRLGDVNPEAKGLEDLEKKSPKYLTEPGDIPRIYNVSVLQEGYRSICMSEGEFDAQVATMCDLPCFGLPGAQAWQEFFTMLTAQYDNVFLLQDDDDAGREMARKLKKELPNLRPIVMTKPEPEAKKGDVTSFFLKHGREGLREKVLGK